MRVHTSKEIPRCILGYSCIIILLLIPLSDNFELNSPLFVTGNVGQDVILPCHVNFKTQVKLKEIQWNKKVNRTIQNIYRFTASIDEAIYGQDYKARAVVSKEGLNTGDVSLKLENVQMSDEGSYSCFVKSADDWIDQVQIVLHVENSEGKQMKAQMRDLENSINLLQEHPQENRVQSSPFRIQGLRINIFSICPKRWHGSAGNKLLDQSCKRSSVLPFTICHISQYKYTIQLNNMHLKTTM
ncbi:butyrophilin subfamily 1 member A1-like isoform 1-T2 [Liasis olivaceus]